jgi:hypothetical protein
VFGGRDVRAGMEAAAQKVAVGPGWRPPLRVGFRGGTWRGKPGFSQILEEEEGDLGHQRGREVEIIAEGPRNWNRGGQRPRPRRTGKGGTSRD